MRKIVKYIGAGCLAGVLLLGSGCIKEVQPQGGSVSEGQIAASQTAFPGMVASITSPFAATRIVTSWPWDLGYPGLMLFRDNMGQDYVRADNSWEITYGVSVALGAEYLGCQLPWSFYYKIIHNANAVIALVPNPEAQGVTPMNIHGLGIAHAMRAFCYMDLARCYQYTYKGHEDALTVPIVKEGMSLAQISNNPRATNEVVWNFIIEDLNKAEKYLKDYKREDKTQPDLNVVYGLKARTYLTMENFAEAAKYAKLAQAGYTPLTEAEWLDKTTGFNELSSHAWIWGMQNTKEDPMIKGTGGVNAWIGWQSCEQTFGYAGLEGGSFSEIDAHLYNTIPATDWRKKAWLAPDDSGSADPAVWAKYTNFPLETEVSFPVTQLRPYTSFKFRPANAGYLDYLTGACAAIPLMRVEEMMLIEAEAMAMQPGKEAEGKSLLETFGKLRNPSFTVDAQTSVRDQIWWQRRVELWGEGFATFDLKRLNKGIIRSYKGTNHPENYRWNTLEVPQWTNFVIINTEFHHNKALAAQGNNPTPVAPTQDSPEFDFK